MRTCNQFTFEEHKHFKRQKVWKNTKIEPWLLEIACSINSQVLVPMTDRHQYCFCGTFILKIDGKVKTVLCGCQNFTS